MRFILVICLLIFSSSTHAYNETEFKTFLKSVYDDAVKEGVSPQTASEALRSVEFKQKTIDLDRKQPEKKITFAQYKKNILNERRIRQGRQRMKTHKDALAKASARYGVQPQYIVALWGIETNYGSFTGGFDVVDALATLAYEGRRREFFKSELIHALKILDEGHIALNDMKGSWAGAMGQNQFMPSSFRNLAVDGNNDGRKNIWNDLDDVFASSANYLSKNGWAEGERWGRRVKLPKNFPESLIGLDQSFDLWFWQRQGVRLPNGGNLPKSDDIKASIVAPDGVSGEVYLAYNNYNVLMSWNRSTYFATAVGLLANEIAR